MPLFLGTTEFGSNVEKIYRGTNIVYETISEIAFTSCPFPTSWTAVTSDKQYTATNEYGEWIITSSGSSSGGVTYGIYNAFDGKKTNDDGDGLNAIKYWMPLNTSNNGVISCPKPIKPKKLYLRYYSSTVTIQGLNIETNEWETLYTASKTTGTVAVEPVITTDNYYSQFKLVNQTATSFAALRIFEFQITEGIIKPN